MEHFKLIDPKMLTCAGFLPWRVCTTPLSQINPVGSMISEDESRYLHWLAKDYFKNLGAIVDFGPLAGGSTYSLATGLVEGPHKPSIPLIHSYDLWQFWEDWGRFFPGKNFCHLEDIQSAFIENLGNLSPLVVPHKGDICNATWDSRTPIEILFIDAAKSPAAMEHIVNEFYPALIPGHSIVVHQDFVSAECPWIHAIQESLSQYFELVDSPDDSSVCFRLTRSIPKDVLGKHFYKSLSIGDGNDLICSAADHLKGIYKLCVNAALANFNVAHGNTDRALKLLDNIAHAPDYDSRVDYDILLVKHAITDNAMKSSVAKKMGKQALNSALTAEETAGSCLIIAGSNCWANSEVLSIVDAEGQRTIVCAAEMSDMLNEDTLSYQTTTGAPDEIFAQLESLGNTTFDCVIVLYEPQLGIIPWERLANRTSNKLVAVFPSGDVRSYEGEALGRIQYNFAYLRSMFAQTGSVRGMRTLEVGCSDGLTTDILACEGALLATGIDMLPEIGQRSPRLNTNFLNVDAHKLPFEDESFDLVYSIATLEHISDPGVAIREMSRTLKHNGVIYLQAGPLYYSPFGHHMFGYFDDIPWIHLRMSADEIVTLCYERNIAKQIKETTGLDPREYIEGMLGRAHINGLRYEEYVFDSIFENGSTILLHQPSYEGEEFLSAELLEELSPLDRGVLTTHGFNISARIHKRDGANSRPANRNLDNLSKRAIKENWQRLALYGGGKFTRALLPILQNTSLEISVILDDTPCEDNIRGCPVQVPSMDAVASCDAVIITSDSVESLLQRKAAEWKWNHLPIYTYCSGQLITPQKAAKNGGAS